MFLNQIFCTQIKSSPVIQSWFKSNHDLVLPITGISLPDKNVSSSFEWPQHVYFRLPSFHNNNQCVQYSTSQPLPRRHHGNRRRGNSLTLYQTAVTNSQLRRKADKSHRTRDSISPLSVARPDTSPVIQSPQLHPKSTDDSIGVCCSKKNIDSAKNIDEAAADGTRLRAASIDNSLDILSDCSDTATVPVSSVDSGRSSCQSSIIPAAYQQSPSSSPVYLTTSAQSATTLSKSSSFNDFHPHYFSSDGTFIHFNIETILQGVFWNVAAWKTENCFTQSPQNCSDWISCWVILLQLWIDRWWPQKGLPSVIVLVLLQ